MKPTVRRIGLIVALTVGVLSGPGRPAVAAPTAGTSSCTEAGVTWRVNWTSDTAYGGVIKVDSLWRISGGTEVNAGAAPFVWQLRADNRPGQWSPATPPAQVLPFQQTQGDLSVIGGRWQSVFDSPRLVAPDGSCTVYLSPFVDLGGMAAGPRIAVLGDDLLQQLNDSTYNVNALGGYVEGRLNARSIRVEVEGHKGRRWVSPPGVAGLAGADVTLLDEQRGLLEHDPDGVVAALGVNDALYIAGGATEAARTARRDEVYNALATTLTEMAGRVGCLAVVTAPENPSNLDPEYQWAAQQVNNFFRYVTALGGPTDATELIDFGAQAATHKVGDAAPWFGTDNVHLAGAGLNAYTDVVARAGQRCADSVVLWGAPGTLGQSVLARAGATHLPSGQAWNTHAVEGFDFGSGKTPWFSTATADGTIFSMVGGSAGNVFAASGRGMTMSAFNPDAGTFATIPIKTDRNVSVPKATCPSGDILDEYADWDFCTPGQPFEMGGWLGDVATLNRGDAVAFTGYQVYFRQDLVTEGQFPVLGVASRAADGTWRVAEGPDGNRDGIPDWRNAWSPRELVAATIAGDPVNGAALGNQLCPADTTDTAGRPARDCGWVNEVAVLPATGDLVLTHYGVGKLSVIDLGDPGPDGRMTARIRAVYDYRDLDRDGVKDAEFDDPGWPDAYNEPPASEYAPGRACEGIAAPVAEADRKIGFAPREVQADPSSVRRDERFAIGVDRFGTAFANEAHCVGFSIIGDGVTEFRYDPDAPVADRIAPTSAPVISGERTAKGEPGNGPTNFIGYASFHYDHQGNLWVPTNDGYQGRGVKVYAKTGTGRRISSPQCLESVNGRPKRIDEYVASAPGARSYWGKVCPPDYNILPTAPLGPIGAVDEDPTTHTIALTDWAHGITTVVDPEGSGTGMTFTVGNIAHPLAKSTSDLTVTGPCATDPPPGQPRATCTSGPNIKQMAGPVDATGRLWLAVIQGTPDSLNWDSAAMWNRRFDQWAYSIDLSKLAGREPHQLTARSGRSTHVQAENTVTGATTKRPGSIATTDVDANAPVRGCVQRPTIYGPHVCTDPFSGITGNGFELGDETDPDGNGVQPVPAGTTAEYRITVPKAGTYTVTYRASTRDPALSRNLVMTVNGSTYTTAITSAGAAPSGEMKDHPQSATVTLPAGTHTMRITAPLGGWELDWIRFTRR
jgi:hypothetical protein